MRQALNKSLAPIWAPRSPRLRRPRALLLALLLAALAGCDRAPRPHLSQWAVAEWTLGQALSAEGPPVERLSAYLSPRALKDLRGLKEALRPDEPLGLLTLNLSEGGRWVGRYGYRKGAWPLALSVELARVGGAWQVEALPSASVYAHLAQLLAEGGLPVTGYGERWQGGLISYDRAGRPQGEVVLTWLPPYAFIDGVPLLGKATAAKVREGLQESFRLRAEMAAAAQASYLPRVALCLKGGASAEELERVMGWAEDAGAELVSLLARGSDGDGALLRFARRASRLSLLAPQRLARAAHADEQEGVPRVRVGLAGEESGAPPPHDWPLAGDSLRDTEGVERLTSYYRALRRGGRVDGLLIEASPRLSVAALAHVYDGARQVDAALPIALEPPAAPAAPAPAPAAPASEDSP